MNGAETDDYTYDYEYPGGETAVDGDGYMLPDAGHNLGESGYGYDSDRKYELAAASELKYEAKAGEAPRDAMAEACVLALEYGPETAGAPSLLAGDPGPPDRRPTLVPNHAALFPVARRWGSSYASGLGPVITGQVSQTPASIPSGAREPPLTEDHPGVDGAPARHMTVFADTALVPVARRWGASYAGGLGPVINASSVSKDPSAAPVVVPITSPPPPPPLPSMAAHGGRQRRLWQLLHVLTFVLACAALAVALANRGDQNRSSGQSGVEAGQAAASSVGDVNGTYAALRYELAWLRLNMSDFAARLENHTHPGSVEQRCFESIMSVG